MNFEEKTIYNKLNYELMVCGKKKKGTEKGLNNYTVIESKVRQRKK